MFAQRLGPCVLQGPSNDGSRGVTRIENWNVHVADSTACLRSEVAGRLGLVDGWCDRNGTGLSLISLAKDKQ